MIRPKKRYKNLSLSKTRNCETLVQQMHRKAEETLESKMIKPRETFHCNSSIQINGDGLFGLTDLEVYKSVCDITKTTLNSNFTNFLMKTRWYFIYKSQSCD